MEKDDEVKGSGNSYTTEYREYDPRLGRWFSPDPLMSWFADQSPYNFVFNNPLNLNDPLGLTPDDPKKGGDGKKLNTKHTATGKIKPKEVSDKTSPWKVGAEWLTGTGPREHHFKDGDPFTELYKQHQHVNDTRKMIADQLNNSQGKDVKPGSNPYSLSGIEGVGKYIKDYSTLATGGLTGNLAFTYLGSHGLTYTVTSVDIEKRVATVSYMVHNTSTIQSATRPPVIGYQNWYKNTIGKTLNEQFSSGPLSKTTQTVEWTETIKW